eukprot:8364477-Pyramimonas_sp.AAC.1
MQDFAYTKQQDMIDEFIPSSEVRAVNHEAFSYPPHETELRRMWKHTKAARLGRLADQLAGARQAGVDARRLIDE